MYHHIEKPPTKEEQPNENVRDLYVSPAMFNRQMQYLYLAGYQTISLTDLSRALRKDTKLPEKPVIITFDDLVPTQVTKGIPVLKKYGFKAIFFVNIDSGYTTGSRVNTIIKAGHEIGSHSYHHVDLRGRNDSFLMVETLRSKEVLEEKYEIKVTHFAYPGCNYDHKAENAVKDAGYDTAVICASAQNGHILSERWHLARRVISNDFDLFVARLEDREGVY